MKAISFSDNTLRPNSSGGSSIEKNPQKAIAKQKQEIIPVT